MQSAPRVRLDVEAQRRVSVLALPDTGADICVGGLDFLGEMDEYQENLLPPEQHPRSANGEKITSLGILPVSLTLGRVTTDDYVHILQGVSGLLLSWKAVRNLRIIPDDYPQQLAEATSTASSNRTPEACQPGLQRQRRSGTVEPTTALACVLDATGPDDTSDGADTSDGVATVGGRAHQRSVGTRRHRQDTPRPGATPPPATAATSAPPCCQSPPTGGAEDNATPPSGRRPPNGDPPSGQRDPPFPDVRSEYPTVFDGHIRVMPGEQFKIHLREDAVPFCVSSPRRVPLSLREPLKEELQKLMDEDIIVPVTEPTEWCAPIVVEPKKDGGVRLCVDLSHLNKFVRTEQYQSPTPLEEVASITESNAKWFTVFDAAKGYHQCPLHQDSVLKTTFITPFGRYAFLRAPYGVSSISDHYNRRMDEAFSGLTGYKKIVDDVVIYSRTKMDHIRDVRTFMERCEERGISLNPKKLQLAQRSVKFAGFVISEDGYRPDPQLTSAISSFPVPKNISELRSFFGLVNQVASFVDDLSELLMPLRPLLSSKNEFVWEAQHGRAFESAKAALTSVPTLAYFDPSRPTSLATDASRLKGLGFVLRQQQEDGEWRIIQAGSRFLTSTESRYATIELEATAVVWALKKCRIFLAGLPSFQILTDHKPLIPIINSKTLDEIENPRLQRLKMKMGEIGPFVASWVPGSQHKAADALSRSPVQHADEADECGEDADVPAVRSVLVAELQASHTDLLLDRVKGATAEDQELQLLKEAILSGFPASRADLTEPLRRYWPVHERLSVDDGLIMCGRRVVVPAALRQSTLKSLHAGHLGKEKTKERARRVVFWPGMDASIEDVIRGCSRCQRELPSHPRETMLHHEPATRPFQILDMDFADHAGGKYLIVVDGYSGWKFVECTGNRADSSAVINVLLQIFRDVGVPELLRSDGALSFTSRQFRGFLAEWGVRHCTSSPHYPRSNGLAESAVKSAKKLLRRCWDESRGRLKEEEWTRGVIQQRNTPGASGRSPAEIIYGRPLRDDLPTHPSHFRPAPQPLPAEDGGDQGYAPPAHQDPARDDHCDRRESRRRAAKQWYDQHARDLPEFSVGTRVRVQDVRTKRWDRCGVVVHVGPFRRYRVRFEGGGEVDRNRCHLRRRYAWCPAPSPVSPVTSRAGARPDVGREGRVGGQAARPDAAPTLRRSTRTRRPVRRLIEEM